MSLKISSKEDKRLRHDLETRKARISISHADILRLHAASVFMDGRKSLAKWIHKNISPTAMRILKENREYN